jgi:acyl-CoA thioester hydrolase
VSRTNIDASISEKPMSFKFPIKIYYEDTDATGIVYHANYLKFFERARSEYLCHEGFYHQELAKKDISFVVSKISVDYLLPAELEQTLYVETKIKQMKRASLVFSQTLRDDKNVYCKADVVVVCIKLSTKKPTALPQLNF